MTSENGRIKLGPGWGSIIVILLLAIFGGILHTTVRITAIETRLDSVERQVQQIWQRGGH